MSQQEEWKDNLELLEGFVIEAREHLENIDQKFLVLEQDLANGNLINDVFRSIHTVKGGAGMLNLQNMSSLAHKIETLLNYFRDLKRVTEENAIEVMLKGCDLLNILLAEIEQKIREKNFDLDPTNEKVSIMILMVEEYTQECKGVLQVSAVHEQSSLSISTDDVMLSFTISAFNLEEGLRDSIAKRNENLMDVLAPELVRLATSLDHLAGGAFDVDIYSIQEKLFVAKDTTDNSEYSEALSEVLKIIERIRMEIDVLFNKEVAAPPLVEEVVEVIQEVKTSQQKKKESEADNKTIRIDQKLIDVLMNLVGEVIVARNSFEQILRNAQGQASLVPEGFVRDLRDSTKNIVRISEEMQRNVMQMRMIPVKNLFQKFPRLVRDIGKKSGKQIELVLVGENTDIDKGIAEDVADPLLHMIRNSIDHGIETPEQRKSAGKNPYGTITMSAKHEGNNIVIEVRDDGKGIDKNRILSKAIDNGLVTRENGANLADEEILSFIFAPGFSTADQVTDISGRGVGMDVVNSNITKLNGKIHISTEVGKETVIKLLLPLTMAVMDSLLVKVGGSIFALPLDAVLETVKIRVADLHTIGKKSVYSLRDKVLPLEWLHEQMSIKSEINESGTITVLVIKGEAGRFGLIVDSIYRQEEIVVKPLPEVVANTLVSGASILGDGKAILILDVSKLGKERSEVIREDALRVAS